jgi:hypothetical protein
MAEKKKRPTSLYALMFIVAALLVVVNLQFFLGIPFGKGGANAACFKDACIIGEGDPVAQVKALLNGSKGVTVIFEGDLEASQKTAYLSLAFAQLIKDLVDVGFDPAQYAVGMSNGTAVNCLGSASSANYSLSSVSLDFCQSFQPEQDGLLFMIKYPTSAKNEIVVSGRTITFQGRSGDETRALVYLFKELFL